MRLILPRGEGDAKYAAAAATLTRWLDEKVLRRDEQPAIYRYHQLFTSAELGGREITRRGFIGAVRLHPFDEGVIRPHERTLRGPKVDRLKLMRAARAHFSQIFTLYADPAPEIDRCFAPVKRRPGSRRHHRRRHPHLLWRVTDAETIAGVARLLAPRPVYIADGHHRYETMLALRDELREAAGGVVNPRAPSSSPASSSATWTTRGWWSCRRIVSSTTSRRSRPRARQQGRALVRRHALAGGASDAARLRAALADASARAPSFAAVFPGDPDARS